MSVKYPQADVPGGISGGADVWDSEQAGTLLLDDFFGATIAEWRVYWAELQVPAAPAGGGTTLQAWNGSAWVPGTLRRWNGSAWEAATLKRWNGSSWITA